MQAPRPDLQAVLSALTPRERQIVGYVAAGRPNKVIAIDLGISLRTAEAHRARIFSKLDARNAMQLACQLCAHGRAGASPILNAQTDYGEPLARAAPAVRSHHVLHAPAPPAYGSDQLGGNPMGGNPLDGNLPSGNPLDGNPPDMDPLDVDPLGANAPDVAP
ncbi:MAG: response regulator transcription factor [Achromobacter pestifer]